MAKLSHRLLLVKTWLVLEDNNAVERDFIVPAYFTLCDLHTIFQYGYAWQNSHLADFEYGNRRYLVWYEAEEKEGFADKEKPYDAAGVRLSSLHRTEGTTKISYRYDYGDNWRLFVEITALPAAVKCTS